MEFVTRENKLMNLTVGKEMNLIASKEYASIIKHAYITKFKQNKFTWPSEFTILRVIYYIR